MVIDQWSNTVVTLDILTNEISIFSKVDVSDFKTYLSVHAPPGPQHPQKSLQKAPKNNKSVCVGCS